jgi:hypothetical protein
MNFKIGSALVLLSMMFPVAPAFAHHATQAEFDFDKPVTLVGTIAKIMWVNPHSYLYLDVKNEKTGEVTRWAFELIGPQGLRKAGLSRDDRGGMKPGDPMTVSGFAARDGGNSAFAKELTLPDGRKVTIWTNDPLAR